MHVDQAVSRVAPRRSRPHREPVFTRARALMIAATGAALAVAGIAGPNAWVAFAARGRRFSDLTSVPARSVAIVPGSSVSGGQPFPFLRDRLEAARALYQEGRVRAILVSGNDTPSAPEATVMRTWLLAHGVPASDVWSDGGGKRTRQTMLRAAALYDVTDAVICTQTLHMSRTLYLARMAGIDAIGIAVPTNLERSPRFVGLEALKTALAVVESAVREGTTALASERSRRPALASR